MDRTECVPLSVVQARHIGGTAPWHLLQGAPEAQRAARRDDPVDRHKRTVFHGGGGPSFWMYHRSRERSFEHGRDCLCKCPDRAAVGGAETDRMARVRMGVDEQKPGVLGYRLADRRRDPSGARAKLILLLCLPRVTCREERISRE